MSSRPSVAVIGAGAHATNSLLPSLQRLGANISAVCDLDRDLAERRAREFGAAHAYSDHRELLRVEPIGPVIVVGPPTMHERVGRDVLASGRDLFVEKPPAATLEGARSLRDAALVSGSTVTVGFQKRSAKAYRRAKQIASTPEFGTPRMLRLNISHWQVPSLREHMLLNGVHAFDLARFFLGDLSAASIVKHRIGDCYVIAILAEHQGGGISQVTTSALEPRYQESLELAGDSTLIQVRGLSELRYLHAAPDKSQAAEPDDETMAGIWYPQASLPYLEHQSLNVQGYVPELAAFLGIADPGAPALPGIEDGIEALRIAEAVIEAPAGLSPLNI